MNIVLHICQRGAWEEARARGVYETDTLAVDGFIHLSYPHQVVSVANFLYAQQRDLLLLRIDPGRVHAEVRVEKLGTAEAFPHLYGPLNTDAVVEVLEFSPNSRGRFTLPEVFSKGL